MSFSSLDTDLARDSGVSKRALVDYLDGVHELLLPALVDRPLSVIRATRGQKPFMQKNLPDHAPEWIERTSIWAETSQRTVDYALCNDLRTLMWFANQRAVEYHVTLATVPDLDAPTHLIIDIDPPEGATFDAAVAAAHQVRAALDSVGLEAAVKSSGAKGLHVVIPVAGVDGETAAFATRAIAARAAQLDPDALTTEFLKDDRHGRVFLDATRVGSGTVVSVYSPRLRPGVPVSWPLLWDELDGFEPGHVTITNALDLLDGRTPWSELLPAPQQVPPALVDEGREIPTPRVAAMHEGRRRRAAQRSAEA